MKRLVFVVCSIFGMTAPAAEDLLNWTGAAGDGKWSTPGNWEEGKVPKDVGTSETRVLVFPAGSVSSNDWDSVSIRQMRFTGSGESVVRGGLIRFEAGDSMVNVSESTVSIYNRLYNNWATGFYCSKGELALYGKVESRETDSRLVTVSVNADSRPEARVRFLGGFSGGVGRNVDLDYGLGYNDDPGKSALHALESDIHVRKFTIGRSYQTVRLRIDSTGNEWTSARVINGTAYAGAANVFAPEGVIEPNNTYGSQAWWDLNGFDQAIDRIGGTYKATSFLSGLPATLTMNATADGNFGGVFSGALSLVWNPTGDYTFDASGVSTATGDLFVRGGTFLLSGAGSMASVRTASVSSGATLELATTATGAFAGLRTLHLDGTLAVGADAADPFGATKVILGTGGQVSVPSGTTLVVGAVFADGAYLADDDYAADWVTGGGTVRVDSSAMTSAGFVWKTPGGGVWDAGANWFGGTAPDGSEPQLVAADAAADYDVTVADGTTLAAALTVGGQASSAVATVRPADGATVHVAADLDVFRNGRIAVPTGTALVFDERTSVASGATPVRLQETGGTFDVTGGEVTAESFRGTWQMSGGGAANVSAGRFDFLPKAGNAGAMEILAGGSLNVSGTGTFALHSSGWVAAALKIADGTVNLTDDARLVLDKTTSRGLSDLTYYFHAYGTVTLGGRARILSDDDGPASFTTLIHAADKTFSVNVTDEAAICLTKGTLVFGQTEWNSPSGTRTVLTFDSSAESRLGNTLTLSYDGFGDMDVRMNVRRGRVLVGNNGIKLAHRNVSTAGFPTVDSSVASIEVSGGQFVVDGVNADQNESYYSGFDLGNSLPEDSRTHATAVATGTLTLSDGIVSNLHGRITLGTGQALGRVVQSGGAFASGSRAAAFFGAYDGEGRWEMTGGTASFNETIYLGIGETLATLLGNIAKRPLGTHVVGTAAKGVLDIGAGTFETAGDIISGTDGNRGAVTVGTAGVLRARNLRMLNGTDDALTVKVSPDGAGRIELSGGLELASGIRLNIEGAEDCADTDTRFDLVTVKDATHPLSDIEIEGTIPPSLRLVRTAKRIALGKVRGMIIYVR